MDVEDKFKKAVGKIADTINQKRRQELLSIYSNTDLMKEINRVRQSQEYRKGNKSGSMRKLASLPISVDVFFTKMYGADYYKDPDFFTKRFNEWAVVDDHSITYDESKKIITEVTKND